MIEERGRVVAREPGAIWVETVRAGVCDACQARKGCGHRLINQSGGQRARLRVLTRDTFQEDEEVVVGIPEGALLRGALWVYALPLVLLFSGALLGGALPLPFDGAALFGVLGLLLGFIINRWRDRGDRGRAYQPTVLRRCPAREDGAVRIVSS
ncbi:SoxR reducing system RseC family protein [Alloalcanivorax xenomutans]|jgi:sigma-E factor negative regulatory protein RseC|uniref:SoxR reducing system RseC family protein n=1 Tax=Alloalcanivorax xenomutans TaxID=1094342 RepID=UPI0003B8861E|nr:protein AlgM [Alcanivorax sp. PN-3]MBA4721891.1 SoxR reducing system RseC family protein [Alcanivorax sp.]